MRHLEAIEFQEKCLAILDELESEGAVITKHGKPVARLLPYKHTSESLIGSLRDRIKIHGDLLTTGV